MRIALVVLPRAFCDSPSAAEDVGDSRFITTAYAAEDAMKMKMPFKTVLVVTALFISSLPAAFAQSITATISIDSRAKISADRIQVIVSGTYTCGPLPQPQPSFGSTFAFAQFTLLQAAGRDVAQASGSFGALCDGLPQVFQTPIFATTIPWHGGKARLSGVLGVQLCDEFFNCEFASATINAQVSISGGR